MGAIHPNLSVETIGSSVDYSLESRLIDHFPVIGKKRNTQFLGKLLTAGVYIAEGDQVAIIDIFRSFDMFGRNQAAADHSESDWFHYALSRKIHLIVSPAGSQEKLVTIE